MTSWFSRKRSEPSNSNSADQQPSDSEIDDEYVLVDMDELDGVVVHTDTDTAEPHLSVTAAQELHQALSQAEEAAASQTSSKFRSGSPASTTSYASTELSGMKKSQFLPGTQERIDMEAKLEPKLAEDVEICYLRKKVTGLEIQIEDIGEEIKDLRIKQHHFTKERLRKIQDLQWKNSELRQQVDNKIAEEVEKMSADCAERRDFLEGKVKSAEKAVETQKTKSAQQYATTINIQRTHNEKIKHLEQVLDERKAAHEKTVAEFRKRIEANEKAISGLETLTQNLKDQNLTLSDELNTLRETQRRPNRREQHQQAQREMRPRSDANSNRMRLATPPLNAADVPGRSYTWEDHLGHRRRERIEADCNYCRRDHTSWFA